MEKGAYEGKDSEDASRYRWIVGSLIYLTLTHPDMSYAIGMMSRCMQNPKKSHLEVVRRTIRYIKGAVDRGFVYKKVKN